MSGQVDQIVEVDITATSAEPTRGNFGTPAFLQYHTHYTDIARTYDSLAGLIADGFTAYEPAYLWATKVISQNPHPPTFKVFRGTTSVAYGFTFLVTDNEDGHRVGMSMKDPLGDDTDCFVTVNSQTTDQVATALATLLDNLPDATASATGSTVTFTATTSGKVWYANDAFGGALTDTTATSNPGTDLTAVRLVDDDWYEVTGAIQSKDDIEDVAEWVAANQKTHYYTTADTQNKADTSSGSVMYSLKASGYKRSSGYYSAKPYQYSGPALASLTMTYDPGTYTDAFKHLEGITVDTLTPNNRSNITANNGNYYTNIGGVNCSFDGRSAEGQYMDLTRFLDALQNDIQIRVFTLIVNLPKVPYDSIGYGMIGAEIRASLAAFVLTGALSNDPGFEPKVTIPDIALASTADRLARVARGFKFQCLYTDAIQSVVIQGTVNV